MSGANWNEYAEKHAHFAGALPVWLAHMPELSEKSVVLDIGTSDGGVTGWLRKKAAPAHVIGVDYALSRCRRCRDTAKVPVVQADGARLPFVDGVCEVLISNQLIEHVPDDLALMAEFGRLVRPGGLLMVGSVVHPVWRWYFYRNEFGERTLDPTHLREYPSVDAITALFPSAYTIEAVESVCPRVSLWHGCVRLAMKHLGGLGTWLWEQRNKSWWQILGRLTALPLAGYREVMIVARRTP